LCPGIGLGRLEDQNAALRVDDKIKMTEVAAIHGIGTQWVLCVLKCR
jgi:hypothetical protein